MRTCHVFNGTKRLAVQITYLTDFLLFCQIWNSCPTKNPFSSILFEHPKLGGSDFQRQILQTYFGPYIFSGMMHIATSIFFARIENIWSRDRKFLSCCTRTNQSGQSKKPSCELQRRSPRYLKEASVCFFLSERCNPSLLMSNVTDLTST